MTICRKKLIEVALPLKAVNAASVREGYIYRGNPSALHKWWAQRPLAAARAVIFAQMVDDPSAHPDLFPTEKKQDRERLRLFQIIEDLVLWESTTNDAVLQRARDEIWRSWRRTCAENADHPRAMELFDRKALPGFHDPFCGGGTLPLEAQRLGLRAYASDLNPVAVLICKAMIEFPAMFAGRRPVNASLSNRSLLEPEATGKSGLADDVRFYGHWMRGELERRIGHLYPQMHISAEMAAERPELKPLVGQALTVIAWLWARTVRSPNPAFAEVAVPLASTFMVSTKPGKEVYVQPVIEGTGYRFTVRTGVPDNLATVKSGTRASRGANFKCLMSGVPISGRYIREEGRAGRLGARLMAVVVEGKHGRFYLPPSIGLEAVASQAAPSWQPDVEFFQHALGFRVGSYGMSRWSDIFTARQLVALSTLSDLVGEVRGRVKQDAMSAGVNDDGRALSAGGSGATAYADAVATLLAFSADKVAEYGCTIVPWYSKENRPKGLFARQAIPMVWDYAEVNPLAEVGGAFSASVEIVAGALAGCAPASPVGEVHQQDAASIGGAGNQSMVISTDPPYYDNVGYADLSDFFYVWLRRSLRGAFPELFATVVAPKAAELVATPRRHGGKGKAEEFFLDGMTQAMQRLAAKSHPAFPVTIYYAFKQSESESAEGTASTGWETFLEAVIRAGFSVTGTWPMRTERASRSRGIGSNALASSIVIVCRLRDTEAISATRRDFIAALKSELPVALGHLQAGNIAPVDLAQAAIGPGMGVYTRFGRVLDAKGSALSVRDALALINQTLDEALAEQEGDFDVDTRWALAWFEQYGFAEGEYGVAEQLSKSKNTSVSGMVAAGILESKRGAVRLLKPAELLTTWAPKADQRLSAWETVHHLVRSLESGGEPVAASLVAQLGVGAETARELAYRLYALCERKKRAAEAMSYNGLVLSWPEITRLARDGGKSKAKDPGLFGEED